MLPRPIFCRVNRKVIAWLSASQPPGSIGPENSKCKGPTLDRRPHCCPRATSKNSGTGMYLQALMGAIDAQGSSHEPSTSAAVSASEAEAASPRESRWARAPSRRSPSVL